MHLFLAFVISVLVVIAAKPNVRIERISEDIDNTDNEILGDVHYSEPKRPYGSISEIIADGLYSGVNYFDKAVPSLENITIGKLADTTELPIESDNSTARIEKITEDKKIRVEREQNITTTTEDSPETSFNESQNKAQNSTNIDLVLKQIKEAVKQITKDPNPELLLPVSHVKSKNTTRYLTEQMTNIINLLRSDSDETTPADLIANVTKALDGVLTKLKLRNNEIMVPKSNIDTDMLILNGTVVKENVKHAVNTTELILRIKDEMQEVKEVIKRGVSLVGKNGTKLTLGELFTNNGSANLRYEREEDEDDNAITESTLDNEVEEVASSGSNGKEGKQGSQQSESQSSSSEENVGVIGNLLSSFLGGLSKPDGGVDVDALVGLIGGLSMEQEDGTYNFDGLSELLQGLLGGDENGGGSDVGAFLGGLLGALIKGFANPPGPNGAGIFTGNLVAQIIPGLSGPAPGAEVMPGDTNQGSGGFISGLISSMLGSSSGSGANEGGGGGGSGGFFASIFGGIFSTIFGLISSLSGSSSGGKH